MFYADAIIFNDVPLVDFTHVPCIYSHPRWSYRRRLRSLLMCSCNVFGELINSLFVDSVLICFKIVIVFVCTSVNRKTAIVKLESIDNLSFF